MTTATYLLAFIGAIHCLILTAFGLWFCWTVAHAYWRAWRINRRLRSVLRDAAEQTRRMNEARMADEWVIREVAEQMERSA